MDDMCEDDDCTDDAEQTLEYRLKSKPVNEKYCEVHAAARVKQLKELYPAVEIILGVFDADADDEDDEDEEDDG